MSGSRPLLCSLAVLALGLWVPSMPVRAQVRPIYDRGAAGLVQLLQRVKTTASVLHTGAHPDDEDSAFVARSARGDHARVAYLSLNRGEGGQNIIGTELFDALGVIRTEELLQARRLDGGEQFFTRSFDYGFSKTRAEAAKLWPERAVLGDMVRVIRTFRPLVVYARFSGTPADGHGQHQFAGYLTPLAFKAAADPAQFPEQLAEGLRPWQVRKLYRGVGFRPDPENAATLQVQSGAWSALLGRTYAEIAAEGRSQHKSQEMGSIEPLGPASSGLRLLERAPGVPTVNTETSVFDGLDTSLAGLGRLAGLPDGSLGAELRAIEAAVDDALASYHPLEPERIVPAIAAGVRAVRDARRAATSLAASADARADAEFLLALKEQDLTEAIVRAAGVTVDPLSDEETVVPGNRLAVTVRTFLANPALVSVTGATLRKPTGWAVEPGSPERVGTDGPGPRRETPSHAARYAVRVPATAAFSQPYFLTSPRSGPAYDWAPHVPQTRPFDAPLLSADVTMRIAGVDITVTRPVEFRTADRVRGELRRAVQVVPPVVVGLDSKLLVVPSGTTPHRQRLVVRAASAAAGAVAGTLRLRLPEGWTAAPAAVPFELKEYGASATATFEVVAPARRMAGTLRLGAEAQVGDTIYGQDAQVVAYPHIQTHRIYTPAVATVQVMDLKVAPVRVGYIMGSGDQVADALQRMGVDVTLITPEHLATGNLRQFDTLVVGVRASESRPDFVANTARLREFMEQGGTLVVQYQQTDYPMRGLTPYPVQSPGNSRVTNESAAVKILEPEHPAFTFPNRITDADFSNWVQERNLYAFGSFDSRYVPLLESADPDEPPQRGGEVYADVGKGRYVYTAYSWFRQLPAGVPGAYRLFANLVSLPKAAPMTPRAQPRVALQGVPCDDRSRPCVLPWHR